MEDEGFFKLLRFCQLPEVLVDSALRDVFSPYRSWIYAVAPAERRHEKVLSPVRRIYLCFGKKCIIRSKVKRGADSIETDDTLNFYSGAPGVHEYFRRPRGESAEVGGVFIHV